MGKDILKKNFISQFINHPYKERILDLFCEGIANSERIGRINCVNLDNNQTPIIFLDRPKAVELLQYVVPRLQLDSNNYVLTMGDSKAVNYAFVCINIEEQNHKEFLDDLVLGAEDMDKYSVYNEMVTTPFILNNILIQKRLTVIKYAASIQNSLFKTIKAFILGESVRSATLKFCLKKKILIKN